MDIIWRLARVLRRGGRFWLGGWGRSEVDEWLSKAGMIFKLDSQSIYTEPVMRPVSTFLYRSATFRLPFVTFALSHMQTRGSSLGSSSYIHKPQGYLSPTRRNTQHARHRDYYFPKPMTESLNQLRSWGSRVGDSLRLEFRLRLRSRLS